MRAIGDGYDDAICTPTSATEGPEEIGILVLVCRNVFSRGENNLELDCVVDAYDMCQAERDITRAL